ncbi:MAG TPA: AMP-binding protein, partial [Pelomicrobium sp.]|nr:AMP-binding protein [Pelomicrobium sp.]
PDTRNVGKDAMKANGTVNRAALPAVFNPEDLQALEQGDRVAICLRNGAHWIAIDQAALGMGLVVVPLYMSDNPENIAYCAANSDARILVLESDRLVESLRRSMPHEPTVVCVQGGPERGAENVDAWLPAATQPFQVVELERGALATICYTSGTTGRPKGAKLSHHNIMSNVDMVLAAVELHDDDVLLSIIPLSHMFERTAGYYTPLKRGITVAYSRGVQQIADDLQAIRPTILMAVPRIYERFLARIEQGLGESKLKRMLFRRTVELGWRIYLGEASALQQMQYRLLKGLVADKILQRLGGRVRLSVVGGAAVEERIAKTFIGLGLSLLQGYGLTECSPVVAANREGDPDPTSCGYPLQGVEIRVNEGHELLVRGPNVMLGYWRDPEATAKILDAEGWLNTGDQVEIKNGKIYIRGRTKDILVLSNGEKLPTEAVETAIVNDPTFEQVMLVGEGKPYVILVAVTQEADEKKLVKRANEQLREFPRYIRVRRVIREKEPWTIENGALTPTMKIKRRMVLDRYKAQIEAIYAKDRLAD